MMEAIDKAKKNGDSIGGIVEVIVEGMPSGVGSYVHYDRKLDAKIAAAMMSINAFKGVSLVWDLKWLIYQVVRFMMRSFGVRKEAMNDEPTV